MSTEQHKHCTFGPSSYDPSWLGSCPHAKPCRPRLPRRERSLNLWWPSDEPTGPAEPLRGKPVPSRADVIDWLEDSHGDQPYDPVAAQLLLSFAAIHGTSNLLAQALMDLCTAPDLIRDIRAEITSVLGDAGLTRAALYRLKLMDSALKEANGWRRTDLSMGRIAQSDMHLSDGLRIPRGTTLMVSAHAMWEPEIYPDPRRYDGYRFYKLRQVPGQEGQHQLVSATEKHMGFGYGKHACPGRFFCGGRDQSSLVSYPTQVRSGTSGWGPPPRVWSQGIHLFPDPTARDSRPSTKGGD
ncbi:Dihydroorotase [Aspergillus fumigatus]